MLNFLTANWYWILFLGAMFLMHAGHGGHGGGCGGHGSGHGTSGEHERPPVSLDKHAGHA